MRPAKLSGRSSSESSAPWSDLTELVLERIRDLLNSNLYDVRLRSVCSNWRKSLAHPRRTRLPNFPINLPAFPEEEEEDMLPTDRPRKPLIPNCSRIYRISPADDPSHGWLFRSLDTKPGTFTLLDPLSTIRNKLPPNTIRSSLDLLQFRISEVCKCYRIDGIEWMDVLKVLLLPNFVEGIAFTVLVVLQSGTMYYCNEGDSVWTEINTTFRNCWNWIGDVILFNGVCYAVFGNGCLASLNSNFHLKEILPPVDRHPIPRMNVVVQNNLVISESDLFLVSVIPGVTLLDFDLRIFKWVLNSWYEIKDLGDTFFLSSSDASIGLSAKDFKGCKGNFVFFSNAFTNQPYEKDVIIDQNSITDAKHEVYDLDESKTLHSNNKFRRIKMCWPPAEWMKPTS